MAANKFATMLHKNCHKIIVILVYAILEWILILLLLLNSLFSHLIKKFAKFFGLKPSCTWCSRLDHIFDSQKTAKNPHFDHVCEAHGAEISKLSYCTNHKRLAESKNLCSNCSSSTPLEYATINEIPSTVAFFTYTSEDLSENDEVNQCSCCDEILSREVYPPSLIFKPSWDVLDYIHKKATALSRADLLKYKMGFEEKGRKDDKDDQRAFEKDDHLQSDGRNKTEIVEEFLCDSNRGEKLDAFEVQEWKNDDPFWNLGCNEDDESVYLADMLLQDADYTDSDRFICIELIEDANGVANRGFEILENSDADSTERSSRVLMEEYEKRDEDTEKLTTSSREKDEAEAAVVEKRDNFPESEQSDCNIPEPDAELFAIDSTIIAVSEDQEMNNQDDEKVDEKRDSLEVTISDSLHHLHNKLMMLEREESELDDSSNGSIISEMEEVGVDSLSVEDLKMALKDREKAMKALYAELEEEREAAAEAATETMAMITKLQEEKAAMQMEALQYQRMMEEQAEYDQEALQLLNDLMIKREKEKKELEKELEMYRSNGLDFESRESDDNHSIDMNCEDERDDRRFGIHQEQNLDESLEDLEETGAECITDVNFPDLSLAEFDEERLSILDELKILESKLFALHDDEEKATLNSSDHERETADNMAKKLLPLFDATENEFAGEELDKAEISDHSSDMINQFSNGNVPKNSKILMQEEISHVYERLQALEEDKNFLKHCIRSMMKGNEGLTLLQEILQHLRDLKSVELSARNLAEIPLSDASMAMEDQE